ncbi:MAG: chromosome segregation protein SMC [Gemmatimonadaceae bacterium]
MRLTKLEMQGFKSFADSTTMLFDNGVTAIVGPNGCGKSNVSDAVRWVLGEQRARMLRGAKMEEVIFQGSSARRPVNIAEVSLFFENEDGGLPIAFKEVVVTRRLSRSGESEYLMNGASCRLRDIHDMLRGTGLGADSGVVIEAKMIDALLSDRPDDRRELFEEAAGVGLYRDRRRSTERRLEETALDLARLDDLLTEVQSQVRSLGRQRRKAERHVELMARRFSVDLTLAAREMVAWREELAQLETRLVELRASAPTADSAVGEAETRRDAAHESRAQTEAGRNDLARLLSQHQHRVQELRSEIAVAEERQRHASERRQRAEEEQREGTVTGERLSSERDRADAERLTAEGEVAAAEALLAERAASEEAARGLLMERRAVVEAAERDVRTLRDQVRRLELDGEAGLRENTELEARIAQLGSEHGLLLDAAASLQREIAAADDAMEIARASVSAAQRDLDAAREQARVARTQDATARAELGRCQDQCTALEARLSALEGLERERVGLAPAAARLLRERERFGEGAVLGPLSDFVSAGSTSALVVERFLGMTLHAVVVRDQHVADAVRSWHAAANPGPLLLLPLDAVVSGPAAQDGDLVRQVEAAPDVSAWVHTLLDRVRSLDDGTAFVDARGAVWLPGSVAGPGPLRRRAELFALRAELQAAFDVRGANTASAETARAALQAAEADVAAATERSALAQSEDRRANDVRTELERRRLRGLRELDEADALTARLTTRRGELADLLTAVHAQADEITASLGERDAAIRDYRSNALSAEQSLERLRDERTSGQVALAQLRARMQVAADRLARIDQEHASATQRLHVLADELSTLDGSDERLAMQLRAWHSDLDVRAAALRDIEVRLMAAEEDVRQADQALTEAEHALDGARRQAHERESSLHHAELRFIELSGRRAAIKERLETEWRRPLEDLLGSYQPVDVADDVLRAEAEQLRAEVEKLGPVNPLAIEEHEEEVKRLEFLTTQRNDLSEARNKLQLAIREIDTTAREMFLSTFSQVRENFRQIFMTLFGGGECDLRLENPDAPLDCDIEIHASPRGKRTQRIHLLSSGERALVALSLLFGIFHTKPSPFCLLDEVDAPLDDANIGRYVRMLNQFKSNTQFIVITHNPRTTTEAADAVYGVTMQEPGVSSLVSVRMRGSAVDDAPVPDDRAAEGPSAEAA